jgi:hypothetical protein
MQHTALASAMARLRTVPRRREVESWGPKQLKPLWSGNWFQLARPPALDETVFTTPRSRPERGRSYRPCLSTTGFDHGGAYLQPRKFLKAVVPGMAPQWVRR